MHISTQKKRFARGRVIEVLEPSPGRVEAACETHRAGCGGCDLAHASETTQTEIHSTVVRDALTRIGRVDGDRVDAAFEVFDASSPTVPRYRTTVRAAIADGRAGYRRRGSHEVVHAGECIVAHPLVEELLQEGRFGDEAGAEVQLRVSAATGERMALIDGNPQAVSLPSDVDVVARAELRSGREAWITESAGGREWRVSAESFFQAGPEIATGLVDAVRRAAGDVAGLDLVDAYAGIGLFAGTVGLPAATVTAVERSGSSTADARANLAAGNATIVESPVESWRGKRADVVIADPARGGLERGGVDALVRCEAPRFVLVSCDTGSLGRDVGLLCEAGYELESVQLVDAFHDTSHVETIVALRR